MIRQFGADAAVTASLRADAFLDRGDVEGCNVWRQVVSAINDLGRKAPAADENVN